MSNLLKQNILCNNWLVCVGICYSIEDHLDLVRTSMAAVCDLRLVEAAGILPAANSFIVITQLIIPPTKASDSIRLVNHRPVFLILS